MSCILYCDKCDGTEGGGPEDTWHLWVICWSSPAHLASINFLHLFLEGATLHLHSFRPFSLYISKRKFSQFHFQYLVSRCKVLFYNIRRQGYNCDERKTTFVVTFTHYERVKLFEMYLNVSSAFSFPFPIPHVTCMARSRQDTVTTLPLPFYHRLNERMKVGSYIIL